MLRRVDPGWLTFGVALIAAARFDSLWPIVAAAVIIAGITLAEWARRS